MSHPNEWFSSDSPASSKGQPSPAAFITLSTVDGLSYTPSAEQKSRDLAQIKATGRRSWKTLKGKAEAVWSPELEALLIEALEKYQYNDDHKPTTSKNGIRFPYRNRFISDYIYEKTGKSRTHKQVGSRLQQLRDTCEDTRILSLISRGSVHDSDDDKDSYEQTVTPPPGRRAASASSRRDVAEHERPKLVVFVQIVAQATQPPRRVPRLHFICNDINNPITLHLSPLSQLHSAQSRNSSFLSFFSNVVQFASAYPLHQETEFVIYEDERPVGQEKGYLRSVATAEPSNGSVYECDLAASFWKAISELKDPNRVTILQSVVPSVTSPQNPPFSTLPMQGAIPRKVSIVYHFELGESSHSSQFVSSGHARPVANVTSGYGQASGPYERSRYSPGEASEGMTQPLAMWAPSSSGYQDRDVGYNVGFVHQPPLPHPHSYPPTVGYHSENYVLGTQSMTRTHSGSSNGYSDYDIDIAPTGPGYYGEPRAQWSTQANLPNSHDHASNAVGRRPSSAFGVDYAY
ncbi:hypothetical protein EST38_g7944 [Candolleomyces aberdarensis]|uniref:TEA domain-containing protein n=1 Tax=Candolleomyces aberdarensis TaxID=2316362 RepID=A0A4Q2DDW3_9AGAR|nr:hypothetical protein EST38_g7944 [Candolleomyces aberdarensis]